MDAEKYRRVGEELMGLTGKVVVGGVKDGDLSEMLKRFVQEHGLNKDEVRFLAKRLPLWWYGWGCPDRIEER